MAELPSRLGPYDILSPLGAGGMGEVFRARDTRLQRFVAVKILHDSAALDPDRQRRFARLGIEDQVVELNAHKSILKSFRSLLPSRSSLLSP